MPPEEVLTIFQGLAFELGAWHQVVQVHDIGVVVLVVVKFQVSLEMCGCRASCA
jgi:hypothetical protein